jgi:hypothetical protein
MKHLIKIFAVTAIMSAGTAVATPQPIEQHNSTAVWFENWSDLYNATLEVVSPNGEIQVVFAETGTPVYYLDAGTAADGIYRYQLSAATREQVKIVNPIDNGRGSAAKDTQAVPFHTGGSFTVYRGVIVQPEEISEDEEG